jgi:hypothetical protein
MTHTKRMCRRSCSGTALRESPIGRRIMCYNETISERCKPACNAALVARDVDRCDRESLASTRDPIHLTFATRLTWNFGIASSLQR